MEPFFFPTQFEKCHGSDCWIGNLKFTARLHFLNTYVSLYPPILWIIFAFFVAAIHLCIILCKLPTNEMVDAVLSYRYKSGWCCSNDSCSLLICTSKQIQKGNWPFHAVFSSYLSCVGLVDINGMHHNRPAKVQVVDIDRRMADGWEDRGSTPFPALIKAEQNNFTLSRGFSWLIAMVCIITGLQVQVADIDRRMGDKTDWESTVGWDQELKQSRAE